MAGTGVEAGGLGVGFEEGGGEGGEGVAEEFAPDGGDGGLQADGFEG